MRFDRPNDPSPISAALAVERGNRLINWPVKLLMAAGFVLGWVLLDRDNLFGLLVAAAGFVAAWLWWSYFVPRWRNWAHTRGADPEDLQALGVQANLLWPKGSVFERTEIRRRGR